MKPLQVDTDSAARTLSVEVRDPSRGRPVVLVGLGEDGAPIVSPNRLNGLIAPRIAVAVDVDLLARHLGQEKPGRPSGLGTVEVYLPNTTRPVTVARGGWNEEAEESLQRMLRVADALPESIFQAWRARCRQSPEPLPPFEFGPDFAKDAARLSAHARSRVASACLKALLDRSEETLIKVGPLPTAIVGIRRQRKGDLVILQSLMRSKPRGRRPDA